MQVRRRSFCSGQPSSTSSRDAVCLLPSTSRRTLSTTSVCEVLPSLPAAEPHHPQQPLPCVCAMVYHHTAVPHSSVCVCFHSCVCVSSINREEKRQRVSELRTRCRSAQRRRGGASQAASDRSTTLRMQRLQCASWVLCEVSATRTSRTHCNMSSINYLVATAVLMSSST